MKATLLAAFSLISLTALSSNAAALTASSASQPDFSGLQFKILSSDGKQTIGSTRFTVLQNNSTEEIKGETRYLNGEHDREDVQLEVEDARSNLKLDTYEHSFFNADGSRRARPTISSAPSTAITGQTISVTTGGPVQSFVLMRYDEATHAVDNDQRRIPLTITSSSANTYRLAIPSDPGVALPGPYMLFAIDAKGTPSVSATISISTPALSLPSTSYGKTVDSTGPAVYWPLADSDGSTGAGDLSGNRDTGTFSLSGITHQTPSPVEGSSGQGITLNGGQVISTQPQATPSTYSEELWFKTTGSSGGALTRFGDSPTGADASNDRVLYMSNSGQLFFGTWTSENNVVSSPRSYNDGSWHFAVVTQGSDGMHMYVDGAQVASSPVTGAQSYTGYWHLGGTVTAGWPSQPSGAFSGSISDAAMYRRELTPAQIQAQYLASPAS